MSNVVKRRIFVLLIVLTVIFIWGQSFLSQKQSGEESEAVRSFLEKIFIFENPVTDFILKYIRKIAHFTEFGVLGLEMSLFTFFCTSFSLRDKAYLSIFGPVVAIIDETIQKFTGRGSAFFDVMIDSAGYFILVLITVLVCLIIKNSKKGNIKDV